MTEATRRSSNGARLAAIQSASSTAVLHSVSGAAICSTFGTLLQVAGRNRRFRHVAVRAVANRSRTGGRLRLLGCPRGDPRGDPRVGPVYVPVPDRCGDPLPVVLGLGGVGARRHREPGDHPLATLVIAVEQVDGYWLPVLDGLQGGGVLGVAGVAVGGLPETCVVDRDPEIPAVPAELLQRRAVGALRPLRVEHPAVHDGQATARVV